MSSLGASNIPKTKLQNLQVHLCLLHSIHLKTMFFPPCCVLYMQLIRKDQGKYAHAHPPH